MWSVLSRCKGRRAETQVPAGLRAQGDKGSSSQARLLPGCLGQATLPSFAGPQSSPFPAEFIVAVPRLRQRLIVASITEIDDDIQLRHREGWCGFAHRRAHHLYDDHFGRQRKRRRWHSSPVVADDRLRFVLGSRLAAAPLRRAARSPAGYGVATIPHRIPRGRHPSIHRLRRESQSASRSAVSRNASKPVGPYSAQECSEAPCRGSALACEKRCQRERLPHATRPRRSRPMFRFEKASPPRHRIGCGELAPRAVARLRCEGLCCGGHCHGTP